MEVFIIFCEFIGLPGSGKTTIANELTKELNKYKYNKAIYPLYHLYKKNWVYRNLYKSVFVFIYSISHLSIFREVISIILNSKQSNLRDNLTLSFNLLFYLSIRERYKNTEKFVIFDEGLIHHVWAISVNSRSDDPFKLFSKILKPTDILIKIDCPADEVRFRLMSRTQKNKRHNNFINNINKINRKMEETIKFFQDQNYFNCFISLENVSKVDISKNCNKIISICGNHLNFIK